MASPASKKAKVSEQPPPPDMSLLHAPVRRGWGKTAWQEWCDGNKAHFERHEARSDDPPYDYIDPWPEEKGGFDGYLQQRKDAVTWAAPDAITLKISVTKEVSSIFDPTMKHFPSHNKEPESSSSVREITISREGEHTYRSVIDKYCAAEGINRNNYNWVHKGSKMHDPYDLLLGQTDVECFFRCWCSHPPTLVSRFVDEATFRPEIIGWSKTPPPSGPTAERLWPCPSKITIKLTGVSHEHTVEVNADNTLSVALASYCASVPEGSPTIDPSDVLLQDGEIIDEEYYHDAYETSARMLFCQYGHLPIKFEVVYRDKSRTKAELEAKWPTPPGYHRFKGSQFLLFEVEQPFYVTEKHGVDTYNRIVEEALGVYEGSAALGSDYTPGYNPVTSWFEMTSNVKDFLARIVRKPRGGWSEEDVAQTLDGLTASLLSLFTNDVWSRDKEYWDPALRNCRKESISVLRKMDECAVKAIKAAKEFLPASPESPSKQDGENFGLQHALGQLKRLINKFQHKFDGYSEKGSNHRGYEAFSKALPLLK